MSLQFSVTGRDVFTALNKLTRVSGRDIDNIVVRGSETTQRLEIHGNSAKQSRRAMVVVPAKIIKAGRALMERVKLEGICKNRGDIEFNISDKGLTFQGEAHYTGSGIAVLNYQPTDLLKLTNERTIPTEIQGPLQIAIKSCLIASVFGGKQLSLALLIKDRRFYVVVADRFHSAVASFRLNRSQRERLKLIGLIDPVILPIEYAQILATQFTTTGLTIQVNNKTVTFANADLKLELPALQTEHNYLNQVLGLDDNIRSTNLQLPYSELIVGKLDSLRVISKAAAPLQLISRSGEKLLGLEYVSNSGKMTDSLDITDRARENFELMVEPNNFYNIAEKLKGPCSISFSRDLIKLQQAIPQSKITVKYYSATLQKPRKVKL
jgi:hypothetical protein